MSLLLTVNIFHTLFWCFIIDFERMSYFHVVKQAFTLLAKGKSDAKFSVYIDSPENENNLSFTLSQNVYVEPCQIRSSHRRCSIERLWRRCFTGNFAKFLRTLFLQNTSGRLLLIRF